MVYPFLKLAMPQTPKLTWKSLPYRFLPPKLAPSLIGLLHLHLQWRLYKERSKIETSYKVGYVILV